MATQCLDDPTAISQKEWCVSALSKDLSGEFKLVDHKVHQCTKPNCKTLKTVHHMTLKAAGHAPCDTHAGALLDGTITVDKLMSAFDQDGAHRGFHAGDFVWNGAGATVTGRMSGITNAGTHRAPAFSDCQKCDEKGVMEGRLCGQIASTQNPAINGCQVMAAYRIRFDSSSTGGTGAVRGTLEGVIICPCA
jgi:hypothetical protein